MKNKYITIYRFCEKRKIRFMDKQLFFKSLIAASPKRTHKCRTVSEAPENCAKMPKSIQFRAFGGTGEPFVRLDFRMGQRALSYERQRTGAFLSFSSPRPGGRGGSPWTERLRALWKHCQKEQFKAEGLFRLMKDINLWIAAYKKLSPGSKNGGERPKGTLIKALETLRDSVINKGSPTGRQSWAKGHETRGTRAKPWVRRVRRRLLWLYERRAEDQKWIVYFRTLLCPVSLGPTKCLVPFGS